jgi:hypothetical protein
MSKVTLKTSGQLRKFLQVLAEEAVGQARAGMNGEMQQQQITADIKKSKKGFMSEEDPPEASSSTPAPSPEKEAPPEPTSESEIVPKYDSLVDAINTLRGAGSTRDSAVERQLRGYFDKLDPAEAASAIVMLRSFADVMRGDVQGPQAPDPSDFNITMTMKKCTGEAPATPAPVPQAAPPAETAPNREEEPDEENTSPPIKVNSGEQVSEAYRAKIRQLMSKR